MKDVFTAVFEFDYQIPSVNMMYKCGVRKGGRSAYPYKNPIIRDFQNDIIKQAETTQLLGLKTELPKIRNAISEVTAVFYITPNTIYKRDLTNMVKATEDAVVTYIGIDDVYTMSFYSRKEQSATEGKEFITWTHRIVVKI